MVTSTKLLEPPTVITTLSKLKYAVNQPWPAPREGKQDSRAREHRSLDWRSAQDPL